MNILPLTVTSTGHKNYEVYMDMNNIYIYRTHIISAIVVIF